MSALNDKQSKELCRKVEHYILKDGYFIDDIDDWDDLHISCKPVTYGDSYEYADYTQVVISMDKYNITDKLQVKYSFAKNTLFAKQLGDSYYVYYNDKDTGRSNGGGEGLSLDEAAKFIANRFIDLVEDKMLDRKLEARITKLERIIKENYKRTHLNRH